MKTFSDKHKLRGFSITKLTLQEMCKYFLVVEKKDKKIVRITKLVSI